jgi:hypothetical protein
VSVAARAPTAAAANGGGKGPLFIAAAAASSGPSIVTSCLSILIDSSFRLFVAAWHGPGLSPLCVHSQEHDVGPILAALDACAAEVTTLIQRDVWPRCVESRDVYR